MSNAKVYWFPAKRHGWGWGLPSAWQGWVVLATFGLLVLAGAVFVLPSRGQVVFMAYTALLCIPLILICWTKGEPPVWRWGGK